MNDWKWTEWLKWTVRIYLICLTWYTCKRYLFNIYESVRILWLVLYGKVTTLQKGKCKIQK